MGNDQSKKARNKGPTPTSERLYPNIPNLANEIPAYGGPHTIDFGNPPAYSQVACVGNTIPNSNNGWSTQAPVSVKKVTYYSCPEPSAPSKLVHEQEPAEEQCEAKQETTTRNEESNRVKKPCLNARKGCKLHFDHNEMEQHLKECLFMDIVCPLNGIFTNCAWEDTVKTIQTHFKDNHPKNLGQVNQEQCLTSVRTIQLVVLKPYKFLVHIKVNEPMKTILVAVQHYNTQFYASKWLYEFTFEIKSNTHMKKELKGTCLSTAGVSIEDKFNKLQCRVLHMDADVMNAFKNGGLKYKCRIMQKANSQKACKK